MSSTYDILIDKLNHFIKRFYLSQIVRGIILTLSTWFLFYVLFSSLEFYGEFGGMIRAALFFGYIGLATVTAYYFIGIPSLKYFALGKRISHEQAALIVGLHFKEIRDGLLNILQLNKHRNDAVSLSLLEASIAEKGKRLEPFHFDEAVDFKENRRYLKFIGASLLFLFLVGLYEPRMYGVATDRLVHFNEEFDPIAPFKFNLKTESLTALRGEDFTLNLTIEEQDALPAHVFIEFGNERHKMSITELGLFEYRFRNVRESLEFRFFADGYYSRSYTLSVKPKPLLLSYELQIDYPKYLKRESEQFSNTGDIVVPEGSRLRWEVKTMDVDSVAFVFDKATSILNQSAENSFVCEYLALVSGEYGFSVSNNEVNKWDTIFYFMEVIKDKFPGIQLASFEDSSSFMRMYFEGYIKDDYGFSALTFNYKINDGEINREFLNIIPEGTEQQFFHVLDLSGMNISQGDKVEYFFEVKDNDGVNGPKSAKTMISYFALPNKQEITGALNEKSEEISNGVEESLEDIKNLQKQLNELKESVLDKKSADWQDKKRLEDILKIQRKLQNRAEEINKVNEMKNKQTEELTEQEKRLLDKQQELENLFKELLNDEMRSKMQELMELMDEMNKDRLLEKMEEIELSTEDMEKQLDRSLELFKQMEVERKLTEAIKDVEGLSKETKEAAEESGKKEEAQEKQNGLEQEMNRINKELEELKQLDRQLENANGMDQMNEEQNKAMDEMQKASDEIKEGNVKEGSKLQKEASESLSQLAQKLNKMKNEMQSKRQGEDLNAMRDLLENLIRLSFDQEELMEELKSASNESPQYVELTRRQDRLKREAQMIEDSLFALSKRVVEIESVVNKEIALVEMNMEKAIYEMANGRTREARERQQRVMTSVNNLALLLDEAVQQAQQQMAQNNGNSSCDKPGGGKPNKSGKGSMSDLQKQINEQLKQLKEAMEKGGKLPGGDKDGMGIGLNERLAKLSAKQAQLRNEVSKELKESGVGNSEYGKALKELEKLMEETETDLVNKRISQETIKRQEQILSRLLESEKADREHGFEEKRESTESKDLKNGNSSLFLEYKMEKFKEVEMLRTVSPALRKYYKDKVLTYFNDIK